MVTFFFFMLGLLFVVYFWRASLVLLAIAVIVGGGFYLKDQREAARELAYWESPAGIREQALQKSKQEQREADARFERDERIKLSPYWRGVAIPANGKAAYFGPYPQYSLSECQMDLLRTLRAAGSLDDGEGRCALVDPNRVGSLAAEVKVVEYVVGQWPVKEARR